MSNQQSWKSYEDVARYLLNLFRREFGLERVDPKQKLAGRSTPWEVDAKGVAENDGAVMLVECRQRRSKRLCQETLGGFAYRIGETGASGGIIVSPLPLQEGAKRVAEANNIIHVRLDPDSTPEDFAMNFFNKILVGRTDQVGMSDHVVAELVDKEGNKTHYGSQPNNGQ